MAGKASRKTPQKKRLKRCFRLQEQFSHDARELIEFGETVTLAEFEQAVNNLTRQGRGKRIDTGLEEAKDAFPDESELPKLIILITDGGQDRRKRKELDDAAQSVRRASIEVIAVGQWRSR